MHVRVVSILLTALLNLGIACQIVSASEFRLGVINERTDKPDHALTQFAALHRYLERELSPHGISPVKLVIADDINEMANHIDNARVDALIEGVMPTLVIKSRGVELEPSLLVWRKGQRQYHTVFFTRSDSKINNLEGLRGKSIAFEAPRSTSAYFVPRAELLAAGIPLGANEERNLPSDSVRYVFADSELNQAYWVHRGRTDAGAFNNGDWDRLPTGIREDLKIIHRTRPVVRWLFSFTPDIESSVHQATTEALLKAHTDDLGRSALQDAARIKQFERLNAQDRENLLYWATVLDKSQ